MIGKRIKATPFCVRRVLVFTRWLMNASLTVCEAAQVVEQAYLSNRLGSEPQKKNAKKTGPEADEPKRTKALAKKQPQKAKAADQGNELDSLLSQTVLTLPIRHR